MESNHPNTKYTWFTIKPAIPTVYTPFYLFEVRMGFQPTHQYLYRQTFFKNVSATQQSFGLPHHVIIIFKELFFWRRMRNSNPRYLSVLQFSKLLHYQLCQFSFWVLYEARTHALLYHKQTL